MSPQENGARAVRPHHAASVAASAIAREVRAERGVFGVETKSELEALGFGRTQQIAPTPPWLGQASPVGGRWDQPAQLVGIGDQIDGDDSAVGPPSGRTRRAGGELLVHARRRCKRLDAGRSRRRSAARRRSGTLGPGPFSLRRDRANPLRTKRIHAAQPLVARLLHGQSVGTPNRPGRVSAHGLRSRNRLAAAVMEPRWRCCCSPLLVPPCGSAGDPWSGCSRCFVASGVGSARVLRGSSVSRALRGQDPVTGRGSGVQEAMDSDMRGAGPNRVCASPVRANPTAS
jgi:hypothetical protein